MHYIIDGNNFIGHSSDLDLSDRDCRRRAVGRVGLFCRETGARATVVFDGGPDDHVGVGGLWLGPVRAILAGHGRDADTLILAMLAEAGGTQGITVISSDRGIYSRARTRGFSALRIHEFNRLITASRRASRQRRERAREMEEKVRPPSAEEVEEWLRIFSENEDESASR